MLTIPDNFYNYNYLAIDPGLNNTGIAIFNMNYKTLELNSIHAFTIVTDKLRDNTVLDNDIYSDRMIKLWKIRSAMIEVLTVYCPANIVCESPFFNRFRPTAYASLVEVLSVFNSVIVEYNPNIMFEPIAPLLVKKTVGAGMETGKLDVKDSIKRIPYIMNILMNNVEYLDEHSIDAIAIGYTYFLRRIKNAQNSR